MVVRPRYYFAHVSKLRGKNWGALVIKNIYIYKVKTPSQHWTSYNPHRLWQCIKQIKPCWHVGLSEGRHRENGLCLAPINRQFIQSVLWAWEIHSETKCRCHKYIDNHLHANRNASSRRLSLSEMFPFERNTKVLIFNQIKQPRKQLIRSPSWNWNTSMPPNKLRLLLIFTNFLSWNCPLFRRC